MKWSKGSVKYGFPVMAKKLQSAIFLRGKLRQTMMFVISTRLHMTENEVCRKFWVRFPVLPTDCEYAVVSFPVIATGFECSVVNIFMFHSIFYF